MPFYTDSNTIRERETLAAPTSSCHHRQEPGGRDPAAADRQAMADNVTLDGLPRKGVRLVSRYRPVGSLASDARPARRPSGGVERGASQGRQSGLGRPISIVRRRGWAMGGWRLFPSEFEAREWQDVGQPWTATTFSLSQLREFGLDPSSDRAKRAVELIGDNSRWDKGRQPYREGEGPASYFSSPRTRTAALRRLAVTGLRPPRCGSDRRRARPEASRSSPPRSFLGTDPTLPAPRLEPGPGACGSNTRPSGRTVSLGDPVGDARAQMVGGLTRASASLLTVISVSAWPTASPTTGQREFCPADRATERAHPASRPRLRGSSPPEPAFCTEAQRTIGC